MDLCFQSLETISLVEKLSSAYASEICEDGRISLLTEYNVFIYNLTNCMNYEFAEMAFRKILIKLPKSSLREEFGSDYTEMSENIYETNVHKIMRDLDVEMSSNEFKPISLKWSPKGLQGQSFCVFAVLNNFHGLSIMAEYRDKTDSADYYCVVNVTKCIVEQFVKQWEDKNEMLHISRIEIWKELVLATKPIAFEWSHIINNACETYAILFIAHPNGSVTFWRFNRISEHKLEQIPLQFIDIYYSSIQNISTIYWKKLGTNVGALCIGGSDGKLSVIRVTNVNPKTLKFEPEQIFGEEDDRRKINYITSIEYNSHSFLITVDEGFLNIILVQEDGTVLDEVLYNTGNMGITGVNYYKDNILLLLTDEKLKKLTLNVEESKVHIKDENVNLNFDNNVFRSCGIVLSNNKIFLGIFAYPCHLKDITRHATPSKFFIYHDASKSPLKILLKNTDQNLIEYWDCLEVMRMLSFKEKKFPWHGIEDLDYDKLKLPQLKTLRWISKLSENVYNIVPQINGYYIKPYILLHHLVTIQLVVSRMRKLLNDLYQGKELSLFQMRSLDISNMYLKEVVLMKILEKSEVGERFIDDIISVMEVANELEYPDMPPCFWCGEKIIGPTCLQNHKDSRCSISMMQIYLTPGFKCPFCNCVAHIEMAKEFDIVICPYCDVPMYKRYCPENVQNALGETDELTKQKMELSLQADIPEQVCYDVSETENVSVEDLEYLALTDSDEEENIEEGMNPMNLQCPLNENLDVTENQEGYEDSFSRTVDQSKLNDISDEELKEFESSDEQLTGKDDQVTELKESGCSANDPVNFVKIEES
ncbi:uncharacterized protein LOC123673071 [Harmonia axyridis]|uniref:uncharacterized protein LOC123673071 n=1 Tax=Harmonia axyridis TaxID=115357 RepID=UPI001E27586E|nr:uncharacterized protein LOC123673071 [Harmonia axyridis]